MTATPSPTLAHFGARTTAVPTASDAEQDDEALECRICRDGEESGPLIAPCACTGTIKYCHLDCLLQWLIHSHTERLRNQPRCGVCQQPFRLRTRGPLVYLVHRLRNPEVITSALCDLADHIFQRRCSHLHCHCVRVLSVLAILQACLWQAQVLLLMLYCCLRALLMLDTALDELLVPEALLPMLHAVLPPICEVRYRALALAGVPSRGRARAAAASAAVAQASGRTNREHASGSGWDSASAQQTNAVGSQQHSKRRELLGRRRPLRSSSVATPSTLDSAKASATSPPPNRGLGAVLRSATLGSLNAVRVSAAAPLRVLGRLRTAAMRPEGAGASRRLGGTAEPTPLVGMLPSLSALTTSLSALLTREEDVRAAVEGALARTMRSWKLRQCTPSAALVGGTCDELSIEPCTTFEPHGDPADGGGVRGGGGGGGAGGAAGNRFVWRWLFPLDADTLILSCAMLVLNLLFASWVLCHVTRSSHTGRTSGRPVSGGGISSRGPSPKAWPAASPSPLATPLPHVTCGPRSTRRRRSAYGRHLRWVHASATRRIGRFLSSFRPSEELITSAEDLVHYLLQIGCSAYTGRVVLARAGLLPHDSHPVDFGSGSGLACAPDRCSTRRDPLCTWCTWLSSSGGGWEAAHARLSSDALLAPCPPKVRLADCSMDGSGPLCRLNLSIGLLTLALWGGVSEAVLALQDDYARWRWSAQALRLVEH